MDTTSASIAAIASMMSPNSEYHICVWIWVSSFTPEAASRKQSTAQFKYSAQTEPHSGTCKCWTRSWGPQLWTGCASARDSWSSLRVLPGTFATQGVPLSGRMRFWRVTRDGCVARKLNLEQSPLDYCRPQGADLRISPDHRKQMGAGHASLIPCWFQNGAVNVNPNSGRRVLHALRELQHSKALVCVLHCSFLQLIRASHSHSQLRFRKEWQFRLLLTRVSRPFGSTALITK